MAVSDISTITFGNNSYNLKDPTKQAKIMLSGILKGNGSGGVSAAVAGTDYQKPVASATVSAAGVISYKDDSGNTLFSVQLPLYNGGVSNNE